MQNFQDGSATLPRRLIACGALAIGALVAQSAAAQTFHNCGGSNTVVPCHSTLMFFDGTQPQGALTLGPDGLLLYGTGGAGSTAGLFFAVAKDGLGVKTIYQYGRLGVYTGADPKAGLLLSNGYFYGTTAYNALDQLRGVTIGNGTIFRLSTDGQSYTKIADFDPIVEDFSRNSIGYALNDAGFGVRAPLTEVTTPNGVLYLYGVALQGGVNGTGTIFRVRADGVDELGRSPTRPRAVHHFGEIALETPTGGGLPGPGDIDNNVDGRNKNPEVLLSQAAHPSLSIGYGINPDRRLLLHNGRLYGTTTAGGVNGTGVVFSINVSDTISIADVDYRVTGFDPSPPDRDPPDPDDDPATDDYYVKRNRTGAYPLSGLTVGSDGLLYGTTSLRGGGTGTDPNAAQYGGIFGYGTIYSIDPNVVPHVINARLHFTHTTVATTDNNPDSLVSALGSTASGELVVAAGGALLGTTQQGGIFDAAADPDVNGLGTIFKFNPISSTHTMVFVFGGDTFNAGFAPREGVIEHPEGSGEYYGLTSSGGPYQLGTVFKYGQPGPAKPLGTPEPFDDSGGSFDWRWLAGLLLLSAATVFFRRRDATRR